MSCNKSKPSSVRPQIFDRCSMIVQVVQKPLNTLNCYTKNFIVSHHHGPTVSLLLMSWMKAAHAAYAAPTLLKHENPYHPLKQGKATKEAIEIHLHLAVGTKTVYAFFRWSTASAIGFFL